MSDTEWNVEGPENKSSPAEIPDVLPLLPIRDIVIYPYMMLPLFVGRDVSIRAVEEALSRATGRKIEAKVVIDNLDPNQ